MIERNNLPFRDWKRQKRLTLKKRLKLKTLVESKGERKRVIPLYKLYAKYVFGL